MITPAHATKIWLADDSIYMKFNSSKTALCHTIHFPFSPSGLALALDILKARKPESTVATKGAPIQHDVEKLTKSFLSAGGKVVKRQGVSATASQRASARDVMRSLGLI